MLWFNSTNAKEIGTLYLIFAVFAIDITLNELIQKGLDVIDTPLVQMIKEHLDIQIVCYSITSMILYKAVMKIVMKSAYSYGPSNIPQGAPSTRVR
jgi:hypothetical protein